MPADLPDGADIDKLRADAKAVRGLVRAGVAGAIELVTANHPRFPELEAGSPDAAGFALPAAQLTLARHYGFSSWRKLAEHVDTVGLFTRRPHQLPSDPLADSDQRRASELVRLACLNFGADSPAHVRAAARMLDEYPHLALHDIAAMAATGEHEALSAALAAEPSAANGLAGPFDWPPLLYVTYSRLVPDRPTHDAVRTAEVLLDAGADPNAGYLWDGLLSPFTALTGVFGRGEQNAAPHHRWEELARLLLAHGADAVDPQTVYNIGIGGVATDDTDMLAMLLDHGLAGPAVGPWYRRFPGRLPAPIQLLAELLHHTALHDLAGRAELLLAVGADPNRGGSHPIFGGESLLIAATRRGSRRVAALLERAGATATGLDDVDVLLSCCLAGDVAGVADAVARRPEVGAAARQRMPDAVRLAAELARPEAIRLLVAQGFDVDAGARASGLHEAAWRGDIRCVDVLLELGADPTIRDCSFDATPAGWAEHAGHLLIAERLRLAEQHR